jgi:hypothetical protein
MVTTRRMDLNQGTNLEVMAFIQYPEETLFSVEIGMVISKAPDAVRNPKSEIRHKPHEDK